MLETTARLNDPFLIPIPLAALRTRAARLDAALPRIRSWISLDATQPRPLHGRLHARFFGLSARRNGTLRAFSCQRHGALAVVFQFYSARHDFHHRRAYVYW